MRKWFLEHGLPWYCSLVDGIRLALISNQPSTPNNALPSKDIVKDYEQKIGMREWGNLSPDPMGDLEIAFCLC